MKTVLLGVIATISMAAVSLSLAQPADQMGNQQGNGQMNQMNGQGGPGNYGEVNGQAGSPQMKGEMQGQMNGQMGGMTRVTLKINAPMSLIRQQKNMGQPNMITLGNRTFRVPPALESITVLADLGKMQKGQNIPVRVAYNNTECRVEISGRPMMQPNRKISITVGERKVGTQMQGYCEKAVISGER